jgi:hypothetical protein
MQRPASRTTYGAKAHSVQKAIDPVKDTADENLLDPEIGRKIWRTLREAVFKTPNQVGGGLGDYLCGSSSGSSASPNGQYFCPRLIRSGSLCQKQLVQIKTWAFAEIVDPSMFDPGKMYVTLVHALLLIFCALAHIFITGRYEYGPWR